jgi:hypothetical protein
MFQIRQGGIARPGLSGTGKNKVNEKKMIEQVLNRRNMMRAYRQVVSNKGSAGIDGMPMILACTPKVKRQPARLATTCFCFCQSCI